MKNRTKRLTVLAILTVLTIVLQLLPIKIATFEFALFLIPVIVGAIILGPPSGGFLGLVSAIPIVFNSGTTVFLQFNAFYTVLLILLKGALAGIAAGLVYNALKNVNRYIAIFFATVVAPIVNTGVFILGSYTLFKPLIDPTGSGLWAIIVGMIGLNFIVDLIVNVVLANTIANIILIADKK